MTLTIRRHGRGALAALLSAASLSVPAAMAPARAMPASNVALNTSGSGLPSPLESDPGWGGGAFPWDIVDGRTGYPEWQHGLAFTGGSNNWAGQPCGFRQATISLAGVETFDKVVIWHLREQDVPATPQLHVWDGTAWQPIAATRTYGPLVDTPEAVDSIPDEYTFAAVSGSKVRYSFDNCGQNIVGAPITHGWIYQFSVFSPGSAGGEASDATHVEIEGGPLSVETPNVSDFSPVTLDGTPKATTATIDPFSVVDATGTGGGWRLQGHATPFAEVDDGGAYVAGGKSLPAGSLALATVAVAAQGTASAPPAVLPGPHVLDGPGAVSLLNAAPGTGMGAFEVTSDGLTLSVPADAFARRYRSDVTLSLVSGP